MPPQHSSRTPSTLIVWMRNRRPITSRRLGPATPRPPLQHTQGRHALQVDDQGSSQRDNLSRLPLSPRFSQETLRPPEEGPLRLQTLFRSVFR